MQEYVRITLKFDGRTSSNGLIDFYDVQRALYGFNRTIALTTHLALNNEIITQAPALKGAEIFALPSEVGSWKMTAVVASTLASGIYTLGSAPTDTPTGHLMSSLYDIALHKTLGIDLDYEKTIRESLKDKNIETGAIPTEEKVNSLVDKTRNSFIDMHRPIDKGSATEAIITTPKSGRIKRIGPKLNINTLTDARDTYEGSQVEKFQGKISSFNMNTHTGRIYIPALERTIQFELAREAREQTTRRIISQSLDGNVAGLPNDIDNIRIDGLSYTNRQGDLLKILVTAAFTIRAQ